MEDIRKQLDRYVEESRFYYDLPGLAVAVGVGEKGPASCRGLDYQKAAGYRDVTTGEPLQAGQIFHMASVSKLFTAAAVMRLCGEGKFTLEAKLADLLPDVHIGDKRYKEITIGRMLTHTSGLGDVEDYHWGEPRLDDNALRDYANSDEVCKSRLLWDPGEQKFRYSNMAYELLGLVVAECAGMTFEAYIKTCFFRPCRMEDSTFLTFERTGGSLKLEDLSKAGLAMPHTKDADNHIVLEKQYPYNRQHGPSSTLTSNLADLSKWARAHLSGALFPESIYRQIRAPYATVPNNGEKMGLGWFIREQNGFRLYGHEGADDGFRASFWICPRLDAYLIAVTNISGGAVKKINRGLFDRVV